MLYLIYDAEKKSRIVNLLLAIANEVMRDKNIAIEFDEPPIVRGGIWYIALAVSNKSFEDRLSPNSKDQKEILNFIKALHNEYLATHNYKSLLLKKSL